MLQQHYFDDFEQIIIDNYALGNIREERPCITITYAFPTAPLYHCQGDTNQGFSKIVFIFTALTCLIYGL